MIEFVKKLKTISHNRTTYRVGLLQDRAYRVLKKNTILALKKYNISSVEWAYIGLVYDNEKGMRLSSAAKLLGVEAPFVTEMNERLVTNMGLLEVHQDDADKRVKCVFVSKEGVEFVEKVEAHLREKTKPLLEGISPNEIMGYLSVLDKIVKNNESKKTN